MQARVRRPFRNSNAELSRGTGVALAARNMRVRSATKLFTVMDRRDIVKLPELLPKPQIKANV
jgi:hypothetical protein